MSAPTVHPPGRLISKRVANLKPGMRVCPALWRGASEGAWATVAGDPKRHQFVDQLLGEWVIEYRVLVLYPGKEKPTVLKVRGNGGLEVDVVMPGA